MSKRTVKDSLTPETLGDLQEAVARLAGSTYSSSEGDGFDNEALILNNAQALIDAAHVGLVAQGKAWCSICAKILGDYDGEDDHIADAGKMGDTEEGDGDERNDLEIPARNN